MNASRLSIPIAACKGYHLMKLVPRCVSAWPKLAWVASFDGQFDEMLVLHGPMVETSKNWIVEAVWTGEFEAGNFDQTDLVFGTGIRDRGSHIEFVSSGTTFDQLWHTTHRERTYVANSLPALMAVAGIRLREDYPHYRRDLHSVKRGLQGRVKTIPTDAGDVTSVYFNNLRLKGGELTEISKPDSAPAFDSYATYHAYLFETATALQQNLQSPLRHHRVTSLCTVSSGYDSSATAVVAREAGCTETVTIRDSTSFWRGSDSGERVAKMLGLGCREYPRMAVEYPLEEAVWAGSIWAGILNWTLFDYPSPLSLFFTGCHGEKMWDRVDHDHPDPFARRHISSLGFCEFRLFRGSWQCPVPFWAVRHAKELKRITVSDEMKPWWFGADYDKPIARRLLEEAGVPRSLFGRTNKNSVLPDPFPWPRSPGAQASYRQFLRDQGIPSPARTKAEFIRKTAIAETILQQNVFRKLGLKKRFRPWLKIGSSTHLYCWAHGQLQKQYAFALDDAVSISPLTAAVSR